MVGRERSQLICIDYPVFQKLVEGKPGSHRMPPAGTGGLAFIVDAGCITQLLQDLLHCGYLVVVEHATIHEIGKHAAWSVLRTRDLRGLLAIFLGDSQAGRPNNSRGDAGACDQPDGGEPGYKLLSHHGSFP
jgi:hypothetical protein